jgi:hypothetical protein
MIENPGDLPFEGAVWMAGHWTWVSMRGEWIWTNGGWRDTGRFGDTGGHTVVVKTGEPPVEVVPPVVRPGVVIDVGVGTRRPPPRVYKRKVDDDKQRDDRKKDRRR